MRPTLISGTTGTGNFLDTESQSDVTTIRNTTWSGAFPTPKEQMTTNISSTIELTLFKPPHYMNTVVVYVFPIVASLGILFNTVSLAMLLNNKIRRTSHGLYLSVLACADTIYLILLLSENWALPVLGQHFPPLYLCNFKLFSLFFVGRISSLSIVCVATDRFLAVEFPIKAKILTIRKRAIIAQVVITILLFGWCLLLLSIVDENCDIQPGLSPVVTVLYTIITTIGFYGTPVYMLVINSALAFRLARPTAQFMAMYNAESRKLKNQVVFTVILISLALVFCYASWTVVICLRAFRPALLKDPYISEVLYTFCRQISLLKHSVNFFFYIAVSAKLRHSLRDLVKGRCLGEAPPEPAAAAPTRVSFRRSSRQATTMAQWL